MRYKLMHISDLHAGPPFNRMVAASLAEHAHAERPDLLVISGDLVQRADFLQHWRTAVAYLQELPQPQLIIPGNHDVPLLNLFNRLLRPYARYRRFVSRDLNPVFSRPGLVVVGGVSAHGLTFDGGRLYSGQARRLQQEFARHSAEVCKVAVLHHPVVNPPGITRKRTITAPSTVVQLLDRCGVELLLCGHIHVSYVGNTLDVTHMLQQGTIICQSGTATSTRGKGREHGTNSYSIIEIDARSIRISQHLYRAEAGRFGPVAEHVFPRRSSGIYELPVSERVVDVEQAAQ